MTKEEVLALFKTGEVITEASMASLVDFLEMQKGPKGDTGTAGKAGAAGKDGLSIKSIALTKDETGAITGGTATLTDSSTVAITVA